MAGFCSCFGALADRLQKIHFDTLRRVSLLSRQGGGEMRIGYARVSTTEQNLDLQRDALKRAGCERIIEETASGGKVQRSGLERVQEKLRQGDVLAVWRLDRLGRSLKHLIEVMGGLEDQGIGFHSVTESIDTTTPGGKLVFQIFGALAEF
jgi:DNA invertase Pin-like site-specific DNA recombinase